MLVGVLGILGIFTGARQGVLLILSSATGMVGVVAMIAKVMHVGPRSTGPSCLQLAGAVVLCGIGLLFGAGILLGFVCSKLGD